MEAEDALKDLLHEIAQQETAIAVARPSSGSIGAGGEKHAQGKEQQRQREDDVADGDGEEDANEDENDEDFADSEFGSRNVSPETVRLSLALQKDWWRSLPDLAYVVTKINQYGKRQTRTIRLTAEGIENVRKNGKVSSLYPYDAVVRVYMKNVKTFVVDYQSAKHSYQYRSIVAMHIVQEITSRLALRRKEDRLLTPDIATRLQEKLQKTGALLREPTPTKPIGSSGTSRRQRTTTVLPGEDRRSQQAKKLLNILGTTEQQRLETAVDWMILDEHTPEGRTLKQFCNNFAVLEKNPATLVMNVRQFMDDMRAYIIERHADELAKLTVEAASQSMLLEELSLSSVVESSLERALVARFRDRIVACLKKPNKEAEMNLKRKIAAASTKPQQFFGVAEEYVVASEWAQAIAELQALDDWDLPCKLLSAILAAAKSIYATLNYEKNRGKGEQKKAIFLSADDFFPIFLFVVTRANLKNPLLVSEYLWGLCDPEQLNGEGGYYLTVFCSAFEYLKTLEMDTESECQQREEEAIKYLDDQILQKRKSSGTTSDQQQSPKAEINSSTSVDSYFSAKKDGGLTAAEDRRQRTTSSPDNGAKSKNLIRQRTESRSDCYEARRVVIGLSGCRTAQEVADEREKTREMVKEMKKEKEEPPQQQHGGSGCAWPTAAVRQRTATLRAEQTAGGGGTGGSGDEVDDDDDGEEEATGSQRARRRASKLDRARVQEAIARYDVSQKED